MTPGGGVPPPFPRDAAADRAVFLWAAQALAAPFRALTTTEPGSLGRAFPSPPNRQPARLEAVARLLNGLAPAIEAEAQGAAPVIAGEALLPLARALLERLATGPDAPDWAGHRQALCEAAILSQALLRAPQALWHGLSPAARAGLEQGLRRALDAHEPPLNNWVLFPAMVEAAFHALGLRADPLRIDLGLRQMELWYRGDGLYSDGPTFRLDGYNSLIIHPMLLDVLSAAAELLPDGPALAEAAARRAALAARHDERMVHPDGSFPPLGRSLVYRAGRFHLIARLALSPPGAEPALPPGLARRLLARVLWRTLTPPGTFDAGGWLTPGLAGCQPDLAERYISRGSPYFTATALLPLGLPAGAPFWTDPSPPDPGGALAARREGPPA